MLSQVVHECLMNGMYFGRGENCMIHNIKNLYDDKYQHFLRTIHDIYLLRLSTHFILHDNVWFLGSI